MDFYHSVVRFDYIVKTANLMQNFTPICEKTYFL